MNSKSSNNSDLVTNALNRVVNHITANGPAEAYLCSLRFPSMFSNDKKTSNSMYCKTMSDYCKGVMRLPGGETPRYVGVASEQNGFPLYKFCLFAKPGLNLNNTEAVEHGRFVANSKAAEAGFGHGKLDVVQLILEAPEFKVSEPIAVSDDNKSLVVKQLQEHLSEKSATIGNGARTLFASKCPAK